MHETRRATWTWRVLAVVAALALFPAPSASALPTPGSAPLSLGSAAALPTATATPRAATAAPPAPASRKTHTLDIVWIGVTGVSKPSTKTVDGVVARMSEYWREQSDGAIRALTRTLPLKNAGNRPKSAFCNIGQLWRDGARAFGHKDEKWYSGQRGRHLVVLAPNRTGGCSSGLGDGTIGASVHAGGLMFVPVAPTSPRDWDLSFSHALADNMGVGRSEARSCDPPRVDAPFSTKTWEVRAPCNEWSTDAYTPHGSGGEAAYRDIGALNVVNRAQVGFLREGAVRTVSVGDGAPRTYTLASLTSSKGTRGLRIVDPVSGEQIYVEYRSGTGRDARSWWMRTTQNSDYYSPGVRVLKSYVCTSKCDVTKRPTSVVLQRPVATSTGETDYHAWLHKGHSITTYTKAVRITVASISGEQARVTVSDALPDLPRWSNPKISGSPKVGSPLRVLRGTWTTNAVFRYRWYVGGVAIAGATSTTFTPRAADRGKRIEVKVAGRAPGYSQKTVRSAPSAPVASAKK